jgi:transposase
MTRALAGILRGVVAEIARLSSRIEPMDANLRDGRVVMSFPRAGHICATQIRAEPGDVRERLQTHNQLGAEAGICPVAHDSGRSRGAVFRWACNRRLRKAITCFADNSRHASPWAAQIHARARTRACKHQHAARILARVWLRVLWRAGQDHRTYDPTTHAAAARVAP